jgi:hypothetical protein
MVTKNYIRERRGIRGKRKRNEKKRTMSVLEGKRKKER